MAIHATESATCSETSWTYPGWKVAAASAVSSTAGFASILIYTFGAFIKPLSAEFGWSRQIVSTAFACASFTLGLCSPVLGYLLDRFGPRRVILPCVAIFAGAFGSLALLHNSLFQLFATFVIIGAVGNATAQMGYTRAVLTWFENRRGTALAVMMLGGSIGTVVAPVLSQRLLASVGWRMSYALLALLPMLIAFPLVAVFVKERPLHPKFKPSVPDAASGGVLRNRAYWLLLATLILGAMSTTGVVTQLAALLSDRGIKASDAAYAVAAVGIASCLGRLITGWLLDRFFAPRIAMALFFTTAAGFYVLSMAQTLSAGITATVLIGFSMGGESDVTPYLLARYFGMKRLGLLYGWTWTAYATSAAFGSVVLARAFDRSGSYTSMLILFSCATFFGGVLMLAMPKYQVQASSAEVLPVAFAPAIE